MCWCPVGRQTVPLHIIWLPKVQLIAFTQTFKYDDSFKIVSKDLLVHVLAESHNCNVVFDSYSTFSEALVNLEDKRN